MLRYLELTALANPHVTLRLTAPDGSTTELARIVRRLPPLPREIKLHPDGLELGRLVAMLKHSEHRSLGRFLREEFSRVGTHTARQMIEAANHGITSRSQPRRMSRKQVGALHRAIRSTKVSAPAMDCLVPIGREQILTSLRRDINADFFCAVSRPPASTGAIRFKSRWASLTVDLSRQEQGTTNAGSRSRCCASPTACPCCFSRAPA